MNALIKTLTGIFSLSSMAQQNQDDEYLADSTDIYDLERRMRQIEAGQRALTNSGPYGIFMR
jgi:hypothetical protein